MIAQDVSFAYLKAKGKLNSKYIYQATFKFKQNADEL